MHLPIDVHMTSAIRQRQSRKDSRFAFSGEVLAEAISIDSVYTIDMSAVSTNSIC